MLREIESYVNTKMKIKVLIVTLCPGRRKMNYHVANEHAQPSSNQLTVCPYCEQEFLSYYSLQLHRRKEHGAMQRKPSDTVADLNKIVEEEGQVGGKLKEKISACQNFLVNTEMENERHKVLTSKFPSWMRKLSMRNLKKSSSPILPLKSTLLWASFFKILTLVNIEISMPMKTILYLKDPTYCVRKRI